MIVGAAGVMVSEVDAVDVPLKVPFTAIVPTDLLWRTLFSTVAIEGSETAQVVWPVTFCLVPLVARVAWRATVPPTATLDAAGWIENAFADAFGLVEDVVLQPAMDATCNKSTHARNSVGRVRMFTTFF